MEKNGNRIIANYINEVRKIKQNQKVFRFKKKILCKGILLLKVVVS